MKKVTLSLMIIILSLTFFPTAMLANTANPETTSSPLAPKGTEVPAEVQVMYDRLEEIKNMDKSELTSADRKALRKEVKTIKANLKAAGHGGIYLSVGAIIIIILLLIL
ncbi:MAG TPA: hypothetical protein PKN96_12810, partial [Flavobacterium sp.]|uniref:hypothetical protein n=1 Tax=Flavobacterium sp. TaxID=239 RepID=UPI002C49084F